MFTLSVQKREIIGARVSNLRKQGLVPAVLYGTKIKNQALQVDEKEFSKIYEEVGESSLVTLIIGEEDKSSSLPTQANEVSEASRRDRVSSPLANARVGEENFQVLVHQTQKDSFSGKFLHVDFYQPLLTEETEANIPLVFEGEAPAVKELGGTLVKNIQEVEVKALPQNLPREIKVNIEKLKTFEDSILIKDLIVSKDVEILKNSEETVALVTPQEKVEEELEKPIEEKVEEVKKVEKEKKVKQESASAEVSTDKKE